MVSEVRLLWVSVPLRHQAECQDEMTGESRGVCPEYRLNGQLASVTVASVA